MKFLFLTATLVMSMSSFAQIVKPMEDLFSKRERENVGKDGPTVVRESLENYKRFLLLDVNARVGLNIQNIDSKKPRLITVAQANAVLQAANENPVVSLYKAKKNYDPKGGIGFCFGRATFTNLYLVQAGFSRANIKKAFVVGRMSGGAWGWHVTTIAQSKDAAGREIWLAIDPVAGQIMDVKAWYQKWQGASDDGKLRLYIGESDKLGAGSSYYDETFFGPSFYNAYFTDMREWFNENDVRTQLRF